MGLFGKSKKQQIEEYLKLAEAHRQKGDNGTAIAYLNKALEINVNVEITWAKLSDIYYFGLEDYDKALHCLNQVVKLNQNNYNAWFMIGNISWDKQDFDTAMVAYTKVTQLAPATVDAWVKRGTLHFDKNEFDYAKVCFEKAVELDDSNIVAWGMLGGLNKEMGDYENAIECFNITLHLNQNNYLAEYRLGEVYELMGSPNEAKEHFNKAKNIDPEKYANDRGEEIVVDSSDEEINETPVETKKINPMEKIKEAKELLDIGAISQEEFDEIKNKYLKQA